MTKPQPIDLSTVLAPIKATGGRNGWLGGENQDSGSQQRETRWLTPARYVEALGTFDLDPCGAPGHELAEHTFLLENGDDGLRDDWFGHVWLNPPYGKQAEPFIRKLTEHGDGVALVFARTETATWHNLVWPKATSILFLRGRVTFLDHRGVPASANSGAPSALVAYGEWADEALRSSGLSGKYVSLKEDL